MAARLNINKQLCTINSPKNDHTYPWYHYPILHHSKSIYTRLQEEGRDPSSVMRDCICSHQQTDASNFGGNPYRNDTNICFVLILTGSGNKVFDLQKMIKKAAFFLFTLIQLYLYSLLSRIFLKKAQHHTVFFLTFAIWCMRLPITKPII